MNDGVDNGYWGDESKSWPLLHFWSLAVEEQFYLITPLLLKGLSKIVRNKFFLLSAIFIYCLIIGVSFVLSVILTETTPMFAFYLIVCRAWELGLGAILAIVLHKSSVDRIKGFLQSCLGRSSVFEKDIFNRITL